MSDSSLMLDEWNELYQRAVAIKKLAPWQWMVEDDLFGVQDPETGRLGFVSIMGMLGEHYAVDVYVGSEGLSGFLEFQEAGPGRSPERLLEIPQIKLSFESRDDLDPQERNLIKQLGHRFRGRTAWPVFRSIHPGYIPWKLEAGEARFLSCVLEQVLDVAPRFCDDPTLLEPRAEYDFLVRVPRQEQAGTAWEDKRCIIAASSNEPVTGKVDPATVEQLKDLPQPDVEIEVDLFLLPSPIAERGERPCFPYVLMAADAEEGYVLCAEILTPTPSLSEMLNGVAAKLANVFKKAGFVPAEITVAADRLAEAFGSLAESLGIKLAKSTALPTIDEARESFMSFIDRP